jgi:hypothetical protein
MPTAAVNRQVLAATTGLQVARTSSLVAQALTSMFTITGGRVIVNALYAKLTIASDASNATAITLGFTATEGAGANIANAIAASTVVGVVREIGTHWTCVGLTQTTGAALVLVLGATAASPVPLAAPFILGPGVITYTGSVGVNPGSAQWYLNYTPLDPSVSVVAN